MGGISPKKYEGSWLSSQMTKFMAISMSILYNVMIVGTNMVLSMPNKIAHGRF